MKTFKILSHLIILLLIITSSCTRKKVQQPDIWDIQFSESGTAWCDVPFETVVAHMNNPWEDMIIYKNHKVYKVIVE